MDAPSMSDDQLRESRLREDSGCRWIVRLVINGAVWWAGVLADFGTQDRGSAHQFHNIDDARAMKENLEMQGMADTVNIENA